MSEDQVRELSRYFDIGAHTMNHVFLNSCGDETGRSEIADSKKWVETVTGKPCPMFCPPGGKFSDRRLSQIIAAGFKAIRTVEMMSVAPPSMHHGLLVMPTTLQAHPHSASVYIRNILKRRGRNLWLYITQGREPDWAKLAERLLRTVIARNGVFHLWGHSWELESSQQWSRLDDVLKMMSELRQGAPCLTNWQAITALHCDQPTPTIAA
jgi:hypothetical protein